MHADLIYLIDIVARSGIALLLALIAVTLLPKLSAATRGWIWLLAIAALPLVPLISEFTSGVTLLKVEAPADPAPVDLVGAKPVPAIPISLPISTEPIPATTPPAVPLVEAAVAADSASAQIARPRLRLVPLIYAAGAVLCLLPLLGGLCRLRRLRRCAVPALGKEFQTSARASVFLSDQITVPLTWGTQRPVILLPTAALEWPAERVRVVLAHELAHIERRDFASGLFASVVRALFWFQPLVWFAHRQLRAEREIACDDRVLAGEAAAAPDYAEHLSAVAAGGGRLMEPAVAMARPSEIVGRVRAILDSARNRAALSGRSKAQLALLALAVLSPLAFVRCAGQSEKGAESAIHETGTGTRMHRIDPSAATFVLSDSSIEIPGGAAYAMSEREVTQAEFQELMGHNPSSTKADHLPVTRVTLTEAASFCKALTERDRAAGALPKGKVYRLPTLREWVLAGLPGGIVPTADAIDAIAWHKENSAGLLHPVAAKKANAYGLHDMIGNAAEWVTPDPALVETLTGGPKTYSTRTVVQYVPEFRQDVAKPDGPNPIHTQIEIIRASATLAAVAEKLSLSEVWKLTPAECIAKLKSNIRVNPIRGTDLIEIRFNDDNATRAAQIADAIGLSYKERLEEFSTKQSKTAIQTLEAELVAQQDKLEKSRVKMLDIMEKHNIVDLSTGAPAWLRGNEAPAANLVLPAGDRSEEDALAERRNNILYVESKKDYQLNKDVLNSIQSALARTKIDSRSPRPSVVVHEQATVPSVPANDSISEPMAIGGTVFDDADDLVDPTSTEPEARTEGVGFRFVMADE